MKNVMLTLLVFVCVQTVTAQVVRVAAPPVPVRITPTSEWSDFKKSGCYFGIEYQLRKTTSDKTDHYQMKLKNLYQEKISITVAITSDMAKNTNHPDYFEILPGRNAFYTYERYLPEGAPADLLISDLKFGKEEKHLNCDNL